MKHGINIFTALALAFSGMLGTTAMVNHVAATTLQQRCGCGSQTCDGGCRLARRARPCSSCNTQCGCVQCPQCDGEMCKLELDNSKLKKTCYKVEQVAVCIPPVRMPWQKSCPPGTSKTRTVTRLKTHSYECPNCSYKWSLQEPEVTPVPTGNAGQQPMYAPVYTDQMNNSLYAPVPIVQPWQANSAQGQFVPAQNR